MLHVERHLRFDTTNLYAEVDLETKAQMLARVREPPSRTDERIAS
jgi:hypothetical protein